MDTRYIRSGAEVGLEPYKLMAQYLAPEDEDDAMDDLYDFDDERDSNVIEVYIKRLRQKIGAEFIVTRRGQGYVFERKDRQV